MHHPFRIITKQWKVLFLTGIIVAGISAGISFLFPVEYRADAQVLIISKTRTGVDPYTTVKSAERVGENIAAVMETSDFYEKVKAQSAYAINWERFTNISERKRRKVWQKSIAPSVSYGTGVLNVSAYGPNKSEALQLAGASTRALVEQGWEYVGGDVTIKVINNPVVTKWPARPNMLANAIVGFMAGVLLMGLAVLARK